MRKVKRIKLQVDVYDSHDSGFYAYYGGWWKCLRKVDDSLYLNDNRVKYNQHKRT